MTSESRVAAAARWHGALGDAAVSWEDVEVIARLNVQDIAVAREVILTGRAALLEHWKDLQAALEAAGPKRVPAVETAPKPAAKVAEIDPGSSLSGLVATRYESMVTWLENARSRGEDVGDVSLDDLAAIAKADPKSKQGFKRFRESMRMRSDDLLAVLADVRAGAEAPAVATSKPAAVPPVVEVSPPEPKVVKPGPPTSPVTARATTAPTDAVVRSGVAEPVTFSHFAYRTAADGPPPKPHEVSFTATGEESLEVSWLPQQGKGVAIYTVVTSNEYPPNASPQLGLPIVSTFSPSAVDTNAFTTPVRHVAVWLSAGAGEGEARASQPVLHAAGGCVLPVRNCYVREDEGTVIGTWQAITGLTRIDVLRVPAADVERIKHFDDQYLVTGSGVTNSGFTDDGALPGVEYEYRIYAVASISGNEESFSPFVARRVQMRAVIDPVTDLALRAVDDSKLTYDLTWTVPTIGTVEIYRSERAFASGIGAQMVERAALEREGITADLRLARPDEREGDQMTMRGVPMPQGWSRAYFTPVTVLNDTLCRVGPPITVVKPGAPSDLRLIERVDEQFLTFAWPAGAPMVTIYRGAKGSDRIDPAGEQPIHELSESDYQKYGGAHLTHPLPPEGCSVHVVGVSYVKGKAVYSQPASVQYGGLARVSYRIQQVEEGRGLRSKGPDASVVIVRSPVSPNNLSFVLVHNAKRLPLYPNDGQALGTTTLSLVAETDQQVFGPLPALGGGFVRLFVVVPRELAHLIAVLDPPVSQLRMR